MSCTTASATIAPSEVASAFERAAATSTAAAAVSVSIPASAATAAAVSHGLELRAHHLKEYIQIMSFQLYLLDLLRNLVCRFVTTSEDGIQTTLSRHRRHISCINVPHTRIHVTLCRSVPMPKV